MTFAMNKVGAVKFFVCLFLSFVICFFICLVNGWLKTTTTVDEAMDKFVSVGGIDKVNKESQAIFNEYEKSASGVYISPDHERSGFPAINALGNSVVVYCKARSHAAGNTAIKISTYIQIRFGYHMYAKNIYIFDPNEAFVFNDASKCIQLTTNIFVSK
jgi:hypothetical protein